MLLLPFLLRLGWRLEDDATEVTSYLMYDCKMLDDTSQRKAVSWTMVAVGNIVDSTPVEEKLHLLFCHLKGFA
jgi:hypothetical protein